MFTEVETGKRDSSDVQITSGLMKGDTVIITGLLGLKPEAKVIIKKVVNGTAGAGGTGDTAVANTATPRS
jgi:membrane fusion protein (multidrug efflux system)